LRVAIYLRISTDEDHQPYSLGAQEQRLRSYVASQPDWELTRVFTDQMSGARTDRPGLQRALTEAAGGRFDLLLVYRVDRFARSVRGLATLLETLDAAGVAFRSATEPFDTTTAAGRMMVQMLGVFAEFERATIIDRVIAGMERKAARGQWCGGSRPYGYNVNPATGHLEPHPGEAPLVPVIFDLYTRQNLGARSIGTRLAAGGHTTRTGKPWNQAAVLTVLRNRSYRGEIFFRDTYHPAPHQPLVDQEVFDAAQEILLARGQDHSRRASNSSTYLLAGLVTCTRCGARFVGGTAKGNKYTYRYYTCFTRHRYGKTSCDAERLPAEQLDEAILTSLLDTYLQPELIQQAIVAGRQRAGQQRDHLQAELDSVTSELRSTEDAIERYLLAFEAGTLPEATCSSRVHTLGSKLATLKQRHADLAAIVEDAPDLAPTEQDLDVHREQIRQAIHAGDIRARKQLVRKLVHRVDAAGRANIQPIFKIPNPPSNQKVRELTGLVPLIQHLTNGQFRIKVDKLSAWPSPITREPAFRSCRCGCASRIVAPRHFVDQNHYSEWLRRERFVGRQLKHLEHPVAGEV
jgi:site-specific DNA recombinase